MNIAALYSFKQDKEVVLNGYPQEWEEIQTILGSVDAHQMRTKKSRERTKKGQMLYSPRALNKSLSKEFLERHWEKRRVQCDYSSSDFLPGFEPSAKVEGAFREIDFVKNRMGIEVQLGKYAFMAYNVCAKMTIFKNLDMIDVGVEIVPVKALAEQMSSGVSYFEQIVWDLRIRGESNIDIPVLILGITL